MAMVMVMGCWEARAMNEPVEAGSELDSTDDEA